MASPSVKTSGLEAALYRWRKNGFSGVGLNDGVWGAYAGTATTYYEVEIDANGTPDTFQWRQDGGGWTTDVAITGALQTFDSPTQGITFGATTGHTIGDKWSIGNLYDEGTTESTVYAQITTAANRVLNINNEPTFTDGGGANVTNIEHANGRAKFDANVGTVTVAGDNGYIPLGTIQPVAFAYDFSFTFAGKLIDGTCYQANWGTFVAGTGGMTGSASAFFLANKSFFKTLEDQVSSSLDNYYLMLPSTYDPDGDRTGDMYAMWVSISGVDTSAPVGEIVRETMNFTAEGYSAFYAQT